MSATWAVWIIAITGIVGLLVLIHIANVLGHLCGHGEDSLRRMVADIRRELTVSQRWGRGSAEPGATAMGGDLYGTPVPSYAQQAEAEAQRITAMGAAYAGMHGEEWEQDA